MELGAYHHSSSSICDFSVWSPLRHRVDVKILFPEERIVPMEKDVQGYWRARASNVFPGTKYVFLLDRERERPDPTSRYQPEGVHGPSQVIDQSSFVWKDDEWKGAALETYILYELHTGTFTQEGTFDAVIPRLEYLKDLGITALELMPVAQFPGTRNWGYDGVYPYAVQNSYGGPEGLKRLVNACHLKRIAVVLDVVYNHLGPEGNYLWDYGPYFTDRYRTPWGDAINFDGPYSDEVRNFFIQNALAWVTDYHVDALRIDAIHGIFDFGAKHFLRELGEAVHARAAELGRHIYVIPESDLNDVRVINPVKLGGYGLDAQWNDDFHHCLHTLLTGERSGYYEDFGKIEYLEKALREGFVYSGEYSLFRKRRHGNSSGHRPASQFVVFSQNHDQVGNRMGGERLTSLVSFEQLKLAAGVVILSPFIPLLFMGEEYGEPSAFQYFVSHSDEVLIGAVRKGRREEFRAFGWDGEIPDPQAEATFLGSKIDTELRHRDHHRTLFGFYKALLNLRKELAPLRDLSTTDSEVKSFPKESALFLRRWHGDDEVFGLFNFSDEQQAILFPLPKRLWERVLDSSELRWNGTGSVSEPSFEADEAKSVLRMERHSFVLYRSVRQGA
jgi:maltooligosyltrehalose trehalohydrolase